MQRKIKLLFDKFYVLNSERGRRKILSSTVASTFQISFDLNFKSNSSRLVRRVVLC